MIFILGIRLQTGLAQSGHILVEGRLIDESTQPGKSLAGVNIWVGRSLYTTDERGYFKFKILDFQRESTLRISSGNFRITKPRGGILPPLSRPQFQHIDIYVIDPVKSPSLNKKLEDLEQKLAYTERRYGLTQEQLNRMYQELRDTVFYYEEEKRQYNQRLRSLNQRNEDLNSIIQSLEQKNRELTEQLYRALEDKYRKQIQYFNAITADLNEYLVRARDLYDFLPILRRIYTTNFRMGADQAFVTAKAEYEAIFLKIGKRQHQYTEAIRHYWDSPAVGLQLKETLDFILLSIHGSGLRPALEQIEDALSPYRPARAVKIGQEAYYLLSDDMMDLEYTIYDTIRFMKKNL